MRHWISCLILTLFITPMFGQLPVKGKVIDANTGSPLVGAHILLVGDSTGTVTGAGGEFEVSVPAGATIRVSFLGYEQRDIGGLEEGAYITIELTPAGESFEEQIVVWAFPTPVELNISAPVMKIAREHLERDDEVAITPALNRITGVFMHSGTLNTNRITIRGIGNRSAFGTTKIRAFLDDIPLTSGVGETTIEDIDLSLIDEIQVWKGPTASTYGAGLGGMIHLKTKSRESYTPSSFAASGLVGSFGLLRNVAKLDYLSPEGEINLHLNYNRTHSDGYRDNNEYDRVAITVFGRLEPGERDEMTIFANHTSLTAFIPSSLNREDFDNNPRKAADSWARVKGFEENDKVIAGISNKHEFAKNPFDFSLTNTTSIFFTGKVTYESRPFNILRENSDAFGIRTKVEYLNFNKDHFPRLIVGAEFFREEFDWQTNDTDNGTLDTLLSDNREIRRYYNFFSEFSMDLTDFLEISGGLNLNLTQYELMDLFIKNGDLSGEFDFDPIFSPRLGLRWLMNAKMSVYAVVSHGFSPPTLEETLAPDGSINPEIRPEKGWNFEIGSRARYFKDRLSFDVSLYSMRISDLLVARRTALDQYLGVNAGRTIHDGLESFLQYEILKDPKSLGIFVSYTYSDYRFEDFVDDGNDFSENKLTGTAPHLLSAGIDFRPLKGFYGNLNYRFVAAMPLNDDNSVFSDAYQVMNFKAGYQRNLATHWKLDVFFGIKNLWNEKYASMFLINAQSFDGAPPRFFYPGLPRNYYGGVGLRYALSRGGHE